ncbi:MAG: hypothetical protein R3320_05080 [Nitriliruptorales bacterium]|nr:hypothetical protein [Nitriliruptorales bacterium]
MPRSTVFHLTPVRRLPLIEEEGLRTRADLSDRLGPPGGFDEAAPGTFGHGKRISAYLHEDYARSQVDAHGPGFVSYSVDPKKAVAGRAQQRRDATPEEYWGSTRPLADWLAEGDVPDDLEVHVNVPVRAKYLRLHAPIVGPDELGDYAPLVDAVADEDRLSAKALMHLAIIRSDGDFESADFRAACALAWRDEPDPDDIIRELVELDPDKVASAALAEFGAEAPDATAALRDTLEEVRGWADENGLEHGRAFFARTAMILEELPEHV